MQSTSEFGGLLDRQDHMRVSEAEHAGLMRELALVFVASNSVAESSIYSVECIKKNQAVFRWREKRCEKSHHAL